MCNEVPTLTGKTCNEFIGHHVNDPTVVELAVTIFTQLS
jgi:hypothetical protein